MDRLVEWASIAAPAIGGASARFLTPRAAWAVSLGATTVGLALAVVGAVLVFPSDALSALGVPLAATLGWALVLGAPRAWATPRALSGLLVNVALLVATFWTAEPRLLAALWIATMLPVAHALRGTPAARAYAAYSSASALLFAAGVACRHTLPRLGVTMVVSAILIRKAIAPFHSWLPAAYAAAPPGPLLLLIAPMVGAYALVRGVVPLFPELFGGRWLLLGPLALVTAAYAAGLALVQVELRRMVAWLAVSQSALVLVGLECPDGAAMAGGLVSWLSAGAAITGLGLAAWMLEARFGPLRLDRHSGLYRRGPALALAFLVSGLSLVSFPGTAGFVSDDLLLAAALEAFPALGLLLFVATGLNGFTVLRAYLRLFHGASAKGPVIDLLPRERLALVVPIALIIVNGLWPGPLVRLGTAAARQVLATPSTERGPLHHR